MTGTVLNLINNENVGHSEQQGNNEKTNQRKNNKIVATGTGVVDPTWFQCDYGSSFYLNMNMDPNPSPDPKSQMRIHADPDPGQLNFYTIDIL
jgi:hypothetical protein